MSDNYFEGYYFKHQKDKNTVALIPGIADNIAFIQVITNERTYNYNFPSIKFGNIIIIGDCEFSAEGIKIKLPDISGEIKYTGITPIKYDIMGPFSVFPMECSHGILSMYHKLTGSLTIENQTVLFDNGIGYIEKDSGRSFPKSYLWLQCNDFDEKLSIMVSIANIPFWGLSFLGCLCVIYFQDKEYRMATYLGVNIARADKNKIILKQGKYLLKIDVFQGASHQLLAPKNGKMKQTIKESNNTFARFRFFHKDNLIFDVKSENAGFECVDMD